MIKNIHQLTLGVGLKDEATFANFYAGKNELLVEQLKKAARSEGEKLIYIYGVGGEGLTHLLQAVCHEATKHRLSSLYLPLSSIKEFTPAIFEGLEAYDIVCVDDVHKIVGLKEWEEAFFHFFNRIHDYGHYLIMTANVIPKNLRLTLPDLISRLAWSVIFQLQTLTDEEKCHILMMRAKLRGMTLVEEVGRFILHHCPRHMNTLFAALDALDKASLAAQRKLTIPFIKEVLQI